MTRHAQSFVESATPEPLSVTSLLWQGGAGAQALLEAVLSVLGLEWGSLFLMQEASPQLVASVGEHAEEYQDFLLERRGKIRGFLRLPPREKHDPETSQLETSQLETLILLLTLWLEADVWRIGETPHQQSPDEQRMLEDSRRAQQAVQHELAQLEALQSLELELVAQRDPRGVVKRALELCCELFGVSLGSYWRQFPASSEREAYLELRFKVGEVAEPLNLQMGLDQGAVGRVSSLGQAVLISDYLEYPYRNLQIQTPHRSLLLTPLVYSGKTLGVLELADPRPNLFRAEDLGRFGRFGRLVAVALHNARLFEQTLHAEHEAQRRAELLETLTEMSRELSQELEPSRLYNSILERLARLFNAHEAGMYLLSPEHDLLHLVGETGRQGSLTMQIGEGAAGRVVLEGEPLLLNDYAAWPNRSDPHLPTPMRSLMAVCLGVPTTPMGALVVADHQRVGRFSGADLELLSRFAALATVALENAQLYQSARRGARFERLRAHISSTVTASRSVREFCEKLLEEISNAFGYHYLYINLLEQGYLHCQASLGYQQVITGLPLSHGVGGRVARNGVGEWVADAAQDPDWIQADLHLNQQVCVPLKARGQVLGILGVESDAEAPLSQSDLEQLEAISQAVSFALENVLLVEALEKRTRELEKAHREADYAATHDVLTRLPNRRAFERDARKSLQQALEEGGKFTLAVIDLSGFKAVNDRVGHSAGDHALRRIAHVLASSCPNAYRVGGDEFLLLLEMNTSRAIEVSEYIVQRIGALEFDKGLRILANIGLAEFPREAHSLDALQTLADHRMYSAKRLNRALLLPHELENLPAPQRRQSDRAGFHDPKAPENPEDAGS